MDEPWFEDVEARAIEEVIVRGVLMVGISATISLVTLVVMVLVG